MKDNIRTLLTQAIAALTESQVLPDDLSVDIQVERARDTKHGDYASNIALMLAKPAKAKPRDLAEQLIAHLPESDVIEKVEIAGPGFINFYLSASTKQALVALVLEQADQYGRSELGKNQKVHVEFVSANPTGPLHVGHGRGAAYGAVIADLLVAVGYDVHREYYVNDAGRQMNILAASVWLRYLALHDVAFTFPSNAYKGDYVIDLAKKLNEQHADQFVRSAEDIFRAVPPDEAEGGDKDKHIDGIIANAKKLLGDDYESVHQLGLQLILADIEQDLGEFGVHYQEWFSEKSLVDNGAVQHALEALDKADCLYQKDGATWFKSEKFGDEKDRVLVRDNGEHTYFASDVAYHLNKLERGFTRVIDVLGADHHGYVPRVRAAMRALGADEKALDVPLVQFANLYRHGERVAMTTRGGSFVTLRELRDEVGNDAARFFYVMRKVSQHMDFDMDLAKSQSNDNPVYYIQYAHARICSVFRQLEEKSLSFDQAKGLASLAHLTNQYEALLLNDLRIYTEILLDSATALDPQLLVNYLRDVANNFHTYYNAEQFLVDEESVRHARLCLILAVRQVIANGLKLLGVSSPDKM